MAAAFVAKMVSAGAASPELLQLGIVAVGQLLLCVYFAQDSARPAKAR